MAPRRDSICGTCRARVTAILALLLACPAALAATPGCEVRAARAQESIPAEELANWEPVDDHALLVWTGTDSRAHLIELDHALPGLLEAPTVFLVTRADERSVYACGHDEVMLPGGAAARIVSIRYLSEKRTAELDPDRDEFSSRGFSAGATLSPLIRRNERSV